MENLKRVKSPGRRRRKNDARSEHQRRVRLATSFRRLETLLPSPDSSVPRSRASVLDAAADYIISLKEENRKVLERRLSNEVNVLKSHEDRIHSLERRISHLTNELDRRRQQDPSPAPPSVIICTNGQGPQSAVITELGPPFSSSKITKGSKNTSKRIRKVSSKSPSKELNAFKEAEKQRPENIRTEVPEEPVVKARVKSPEAQSNPPSYATNCRTSFIILNANLNSGHVLPMLMQQSQPLHVPVSSYAQNRLLVPRGTVVDPPKDIVLPLKGNLRGKRKKPMKAPSPITNEATNEVDLAEAAKSILALEQFSTDSGDSSIDSDQEPHDPKRTKDSNPETIHRECSQNQPDQNVSTTSSHQEKTEPKSAIKQANDMPASEGINGSSNIGGIISHSATGNVMVTGESKKYYSSVVSSSESNLVQVQSQSQVQRVMNDGGTTAQSSGNWTWSTRNNFTNLGTNTISTYSGMSGASSSLPSGAMNISLERDAIKKQQATKEPLENSTGQGLQQNNEKSKSVENQKEKSIKAQRPPVQTLNSNTHARVVQLPPFADIGHSNPWDVSQASVTTPSSDTWLPNLSWPINSSIAPSTTTSQVTWATKTWNNTDSSLSFFPRINSDERRVNPQCQAIRSSYNPCAVNKKQGPSDTQLPTSGQVPQFTNFHAEKNFGDIHPQHMTKAHSYNMANVTGSRNQHPNIAKPGEAGIVQANLANKDSQKQPQQQSVFSVRQLVESPVESGKITSSKTPTHEISQRHSRNSSPGSSAGQQPSDKEGIHYTAGTKGPSSSTSKSGHSQFKANGGKMGYSAESLVSGAKGHQSLRNSHQSRHVSDYNAPENNEAFHNNYYPTQGCQGGSSYRYNSSSTQFQNFASHPYPSPSAPPWTPWNNSTFFMHQGHQNPCSMISSSNLSPVHDNNYNSYIGHTYQHSSAPHPNTSNTNNNIQPLHRSRSGQEGRTGRNQNPTMHAPTLDLDIFQEVGTNRYNLDMNIQDQPAKKPFKDKESGQQSHGVLNPFVEGLSNMLDQSSYNNYMYLGFPALTPPGEDSPMGNILNTPTKQQQPQTQTQQQCLGQDKNLSFAAGGSKESDAQRRASDPGTSQMDTSNQTFTNFNLSNLFPEMGGNKGASMGNAREVKGSRNAYQITSQEQDLCG